MSPLIVNGRTEKDLLKACLQGDRLAQRDIFNMYAGKMMAICIRYSRHKHEAEDILQDGFVKVFTHLAEFENSGSFEGWVRRIIINTAIKNNQKKSFSHEDIGLDQIKEDSVGPEVFSALQVSLNGLKSSVQPCSASKLCAASAGTGEVLITKHMLVLWRLAQGCV